jgi:uncharacterized repeat protein (TIGR03803 family)
MTVLTILVVVLALALDAHAATEKVLYSFKGGSDGKEPVGPLLTDAAGNLYGVTFYGGVYGVGAGTVFELTLSGGNWKERLLHTFGKGNDGAVPQGITFGGGGAIYGTTAVGGGQQKLCSAGCGTVFALKPGSGGRWRETVVHRFMPAEGDGFDPDGGLLLDGVGNMYGTTAAGGAGGCSGGCGTVFKLTPKRGGGWSESVIHSFNGEDGQYAVGSLVFDAQGNLYGATGEGGAYGYGTVFELSPQGNEWSETVVYDFNYHDGDWPSGGLIFDKAGGLYGVTVSGDGYDCGASGCGVAFSLASGSGGPWSETILHDFTGGKDGMYPTGPLLLDREGNLYGAAGGDNADPGDIFELVPAAGEWRIRVLYGFRRARSECSDFQG